MSARVVVSTPGPQGPPGETGATGATGAAGLPNVFCGEFTVPASSGPLSVTGVGFTPKYVEFRLRVDDSTTVVNTSFGRMHDDGVQQCESFRIDATTRVRASEDVAFCALTTGSVPPPMQGVFASMDADGFTVEVTNPTGVTFNMGFTAFG